MNDDPTDVKILFAQIAHNEKLQELINKVAEYFIDIGKFYIYIYIKYRIKYLFETHIFCANIKVVTMSISFII